MALADDVRAQLDGWGLAGTAEGAAALDICERLGDIDLRPAAAAQLHAQLRALLVDLRKLAPEAADEDGLDELTQQRERRRRAAGMG
jgi:hypothetical protein